MSASIPDGLQAILPAPSWRRAGDFVFVSSIYPVGPDGALARSCSPSRSVGQSEVAAQTRAVLDTLAEVLAEGGTSLARVLKVEAYLADAADFYEFKQVYADFFRSELPARTTIVVGDEHIVEGSRLNLHAVALATDSAYERVVVRSEDVPDPTDAEHASLAVKAGPFVFCSGFPATDFETGLAAANPPGFPYHGSNARLQAEYVLDNLGEVLHAAGSSLDQGLKVQFYETDLENFPIVDRVWGDRVGVPPTRSSMACRGFLVPGALWVANLIALVPGEGLEKQETRAGIPWHPVDAGKANFSPGILAGDWLFTAGQIPVPDITKHEWVRSPVGLPHYWSDIERQTEFTTDLLRRQLEANGLGLHDVVDARIYLVEPRRDFRGFARVWSRLFDGIDPKPSMSVIPSKQADGRDGVMVDGPTIEIDLISMRGAS